MLFAMSYNGGNTTQFNFGWIILIVFWFAVYMVPTIVAVIRKVPNGL